MAATVKVLSLIEAEVDMTGLGAVTLWTSPTASQLGANSQFCLRMRVRCWDGSFNAGWVEYNVGYVTTGAPVISQIGALNKTVACDTGIVSITITSSIVAAAIQISVANGQGTNPCHCLMTGEFERYAQ